MEREREKEEKSKKKDIVVGRMVLCLFLKKHFVTQSIS